MGAGVFGSAAFNTQGYLSELEMWQLDSENHTRTNFRVVPKAEFKINQTVNVANVFGYSMLIPMEIIWLHGFMDTSYFLYYEETDYCLKLLKKRIPSYWVGSSKVNHEKQGSLKNNLLLKEIIEYYLYRNLFSILFRHGKLAHIYHFVLRFFMRFLSANVLGKTKVPTSTR